jgi:hypothetical protein
MGFLEWQIIYSYGGDSIKMEIDWIAIRNTIVL